MRFEGSKFTVYVLGLRVEVFCERKHGLSTEQGPVSAYVGSSKNLKDLKAFKLVRRKSIRVNHVKELLVSKIIPYGGAQNPRSLGPPKGQHLLMILNNRCIGTSTAAMHFI